MTETSPWVKFGVVAGLVVLVGLVVGLGFIIKFQIDMTFRQENIEKSLVEMKQLADGIVRSQGGYVSKEDLEKKFKDLDVSLEAIQTDLDTLGADLRGINAIIASSVGYHGTNLPSTGTKPGDGNQPWNVPDPFGYLSNQQNFSINEPFADGVNVPFGQSAFSAWKDKPWGLDVYPRNYNVTTIIGQDADGRHYTYNKFSIDVQGKNYVVPVHNSEFVEVYPEPKLRFSPRLYLAVDGGALIDPGSPETIGTAPEPTASGELTPSVQVVLFSYGKTKVDPDWSILGVGIGYETQANRPALVVSPISYNVGHHIPLVNNLHVGPTVTLDTKGDVGILGGVRVGL